MENKIVMVKEVMYQETGTLVDFYRENSGEEIYMTALQLGETLGYENAQKGIDKLIERNEQLKTPEFSMVVDLEAADGKVYKTRVFNEDGIYEAAFLSKTDKAEDFRRWVRKILKGLRKGEVQLQKRNPDTMIDQLGSLVEGLENNVNAALKSVEVEANAKLESMREQLEAATNNIINKVINDRVTEIRKELDPYMHDELVKELNERQQEHYLLEHGKRLDPRLEKIEERLKQIDKELGSLTKAESTRRRKEIEKGD